MSLGSFVTVSIGVQNTAISRAGFGTPLIACYHALNGDRVRTYTTLQGLLDDGFAATHPAYLAAAAMLAQRPHPTSFKVGRTGNAPTQKGTITVGTATVGVTYTIALNGTEFSHLATTGQTVAQIAGALEDLITAGSEPVSAVDVLDGTITLTADVAANMYTIELSDSSNTKGGLMSYEDTTTQPGGAGALAVDFAAMSAEDDDFYGVIVALPKSAAIIAAVAAYTETVRKLFVTTTMDGDVLTTATDDIASTLETANYNRTAVMWHHAPHEYADAAWMAQRFSRDPGSATWALKELAGISTSNLSETHLTRIEGKTANYYVPIAGVGITYPGKVSGDEWIDVIRGTDWYEARLQERIFALLAGSEKIPFTDAGIGLIEAQIRAQREEGIKAGYLVRDDDLPITVPLAADVSTADKTARTLTGVSFGARLAGAIHKTTITGTISL